MTARFNEILVIDSIPERDFNTAIPLVRDMEDWRAAVGGNPPTVSYGRVEDAQEFVSLLSDLAVKAEDGSYVPLLHIECHGSEDGLGFADDSFLAWKQIAPSLQALNVATRLNLVVVVAACDGSYLTMAMEVHERAPVWAVLGPARKIQAGHLRDAFSAYYSALFITGSSMEAFKALRATSEGSIFTLISAEEMFRAVCLSYLRTHGSRSAIRLRALKMQANLKRIGRRFPLREIERHLRSSKYFRRFRDSFFMVDIYDDHDRRFPTYQEAMNRDRREKN